MISQLFCKPTVNASGELVISIDTWFETGITETGFPHPPPKKKKMVKEKLIQGRAEHT